MPSNLPQLHLKLLRKKQFKKTQEETGDLIVNKIADRHTKVSIISQQNNSETIPNEDDKDIPKERYIPPERDKKVLMI